MSEVIELRRYGAPSSPPILVLADLQQDHVTAARIPQAEIEAALANCRTALQFARRNRFPVAFTRFVPQTQFIDPATMPAAWIDGFVPIRTDMVFDHDKPSCYTSPEFADVIAQGGRHFMLAGLSGERACLATAIDAGHRGHRVTLLVDASASRPLGGLDSGASHRVVAELIALNGGITTTSAWIATYTREAATAVRH